jgi:hypothetical protein
MSAKVYQIEESTTYYIPCKEKHLGWLDEWAKIPESEGRTVFFGSPEDEEKDTIFIICHGTPEGYIKLFDKAYYPESVLRGLIQDGFFKGSNIKHVLTLSCYGGNQIPATVDGITIESLHTSVEKVYIQGFTKMPTSTGCAIKFTLDYNEEGK